MMFFVSYSSLHNRRTVIHRNLFYALLMEVTVRMVLYSQQSNSFDDVDPQDESRKGIEYFPYVCEGAYVLLEYSRLVVYGWMFIEGIFLNTLISANTLRNEIPINYFYVGGWGVPALLISIWATVVGKHYSKESINTCWYGYNYLPSYYIIQGPILAVVSINLVFLGTIMSVIIMKLRRTNDSELRKIQKTIRATLILLPLLGIINIFNLFDYPLDGSSTGFAIWAYFTHFFRSFQGVFISFIYCFSNGEVIKALKKKWERRNWFRFRWLERRPTIPTVPPRERPIFAIADNENIELVPMPMPTWTRPSSTHVVSDIEAGIEAPGQDDNVADDENFEFVPITTPTWTCTSFTHVVDVEAAVEAPSHEREASRAGQHGLSTHNNRTLSVPIMLSETDETGIILPFKCKSLSLTDITVDVSKMTFQRMNKLNFYQIQKPVQGIAASAESLSKVSVGVPGISLGGNYKHSPWVRREVSEIDELSSPVLMFKREMYGPASQLSVRAEPTTSNCMRAICCCCCCCKVDSPPSFADQGGSFGPHTPHTMPRRAPRDVFVRPGLVTRNSRRPGYRSKSCDCL